MAAVIGRMQREYILVLRLHLLWHRVELWIPKQIHWVWASHLFARSSVARTAEWFPQAPSSRGLQCSRFSLHRVWVGPIHCSAPFSIALLEEGSIKYGLLKTRPAIRIRRQNSVLYRGRKRVLLLYLSLSKSCTIFSASRVLKSLIKWFDLKPQAIQCQSASP